MAIIELKIHDIVVDGGSANTKPKTTDVSIMTNKKYDDKVTAENVPSSISLEGESEAVNKYALYITDFSFRKMMYEPTAIIVRIDVYPVGQGRAKANWDPIPKTILDKALLKKRVSLKSLVDENTKDENKKVIGSDYYIGEVQPHYKSGSMYMIVKIFSLDNLMTVKQDSKTFVAKKFCSEILEQELKNYPLPWDSQKHITCKNNMKVLAYEAKDKKKTEHIFPYLVQYNESFQDMAIRTANRWGEFFFYENGTINVGYDDTAKAIKKDDWKELTYCEIDDGLEVEIANKFAAEAAYDDNIIDSQVEKDPQKLKNQMGCGPKDGLDTWLMKQFPKFFSNTKTIPTWIGNTLFDNTYDLLVAKHNQGYLNEQSNSKYFSKKTPAEQYGYQDSPDKFNLFSELNSTYTENKYRNILLKELQASKNAIVLDYNTSYPDLKLGQIIEVNKKEYLVINVECNTKEKSLVINDKQEIVPLDTTPTLLFKVRAISKICNWKDKDGKAEPDMFYPTIIPAGHIRTSGPQLAIVSDADDPSNQNRVRILFPAWQEVPKGEMDAKAKEMSTPWIVYATSSASQGNGIFGRHYEGDQVIVNFAHGNVERPYIVGGLSMKGNKVPGGLFERDIVLTSPGGHALRIEDGSGAGLTAFLSGIIAPGYELLTTCFPSLSGGDIFKLFGNDTLTKNSKNFEGGFQLTDKYGIYTISGSTDGRNVSVKSPWGDVNISAFTGISIEAPNGDISIKGKNVSIEAGNNLELKSGTNVSYHKFKHGDTGGGSFGLSSAEVLLAATKKLASKFHMIDFSYLRSVAEVVFRPVEGALTVKSNRFLKLEAGKGECDYPVTAYKDKVLQEKEAKDTKTIRKGLKMKASIVELVSKVGVLAGEVDRRYIENYNACVNLYKMNNKGLRKVVRKYTYLAEGYNNNHDIKICKTLEELDKALWAKPPYNKKQITEETLGFEECFQVNNEQNVGMETTKEFASKNPAWESYPYFSKRGAVITERKKARKEIVKAARELREAICKFLEDRELSKEVIGNEIGWFITTAVPSNYKSAMEKAFAKESLGDSFYYKDITDEQKTLQERYQEDELAPHRKALKRKAAIILLEELGFKDEWRKPLKSEIKVIAPVGVKGIPVPPPLQPEVPKIAERPFKEEEVNNELMWNRYVNTISSVPKLDKAQYALAKTILDGLKGIVDVDTVSDWHKTRKENSSWSNAKNGGILFTSDGNTYALNQEISEIETAGKENLCSTDDPKDEVNNFLNALKKGLKQLN